MGIKSTASNIAEITMQPQHVSRTSLHDFEPTNTDKFK